MKVVLNKQYGGFTLSYKAMCYMRDMGSKIADEELKTYYSHYKNRDFYGFAFTHKKNRTDPLLIKAIEDLGKEANGECCTLKIIEIPDNVHFIIKDFDGYESLKYSYSDSIYLKEY